jgi:hypothetical protein
MLVNPSFETPGLGWQNNHGDPFHTYSADIYPAMVRSGNYSYVNGGSFFGGGPIPPIRLWQTVSGVTPGTTYRAGVWIRVWQSNGSDRSISDAATSHAARLCVNVQGADDPRDPGTFCSPFVQPRDVWQLVTLDVVATENPLVVILQARRAPAPEAENEVAVFDDAVLNPVSVVPTATPVPLTDPPPRPAPVPFSPQALVESMSQAQSNIGNLGGLLDRLVNGEPGTCDEFLSNYQAVATASRYQGVPGDWQAIYNEYEFAVQEVRNTSEAVFYLCVSGGGVLTPLNYSVSRAGVNTALERLNPALEQARQRLGG